MNSFGNDQEYYESLYDTDCVGGCGYKTNGSQFCCKTYCINELLEEEAVMEPKQIIKLIDDPPETSEENSKKRKNTEFKEKKIIKRVKKEN